MIRRFISFLLRCRLEDVVAACVSLALALLCLTTRVIHTFQVGFLDVVFILLPVGVLGVKALLGMLSSGTDEKQDVDPTKFVLSFFKPLAKIMRDWFPFLLLTACYYSLFGNLILRINPNLADPTLAKIDATIFGTQPSFLLEPFIHPGLTDFFNVIYFSHVIIFPGAALYFYLKGEEKPFRRIMMGLLTIMLMGFTSYMLVPAVGPDSYFASHYTHELNGRLISRGVDYIIAKGRVDCDCFPSLHVAIPLLLTFYIRQYRPRWFIPMVLYVACMCFATIYLRYHYVTDVIASFAFAPAAYFLNDFALSRWPGEKIAIQSAKDKEKVPSTTGDLAGPLKPLT